MKQLTRLTLKNAAAPFHAGARNWALHTPGAKIRNAASNATKVAKIVTTKTGRENSSCSRVFTRTGDAVGSDMGPP